jgi:enoyl-CoA hydratase/carnithine racemase
MTSPVIFQTRDSGGGKQVGIATLNAPKALNSLSLEMIDLLDEQLRIWQSDDNIAAVVLDAEGEKAFCAGGDIVKLYHAMAETPVGERVDYAEQFFGREYRLDYLLHSFGKPLLCWGHGIVMGGGLGLLSGCSHRVVTEQSRIAMPEITIGLFPDVGGSWFLSRMPGRTGLFLGLTGANINAHDAVFVGLADRVLPHDTKASVLDALSGTAWSGGADDYGAVSAILRQHQLPADALPHSPVREHFDLINTLCDADSLPLLVDRITALDSDDKWLGKAVATLKKGCAQTAWLVWECQRRARQKSVREVFQMEWIVAVQCAMHADFREGVRALLIDKDGAPDFRFEDPGQLPAEYVAGFFDCPTDTHPLEDL